MDEECVRRRGWLTREQFLDVLGASNLIPGPTSTEVAMHAGLRRAGWPGLVVAGICFILPASLLVAAIAVLYVRAGALPVFDGMLRAVKPVVVAVVLQALVGLARTALSSWRMWLLGALAVVATAAGLNEIAVLVGAGALNAIAGRRPVAVMAITPVSLFAYFL